MVYDWATKTRIVVFCNNAKRQKRDENHDDYRYFKVKKLLWQNVRCQSVVMRYNKLIIKLPQSLCWAPAHRCQNNVQGNILLLCFRCSICSCAVGTNLWYSFPELSSTPLAHREIVSLDTARCVLTLLMNRQFSAFRRPWVRSRYSFRAIGTDSGILLKFRDCGTCRWVSWRTCFSVVKYVELTGGFCKLHGWNCYQVYWLSPLASD